MRRDKEIEACKQQLEDEGVDHLHIRRRVIATGFRDAFLDELNDYDVITVDVGTWDYAQLVYDVRWQVQEQLSKPKYLWSRFKLKALGVLGFTASGELEAEPDYARASKYLKKVADSERGVVVLLQYTGEEQIEDFAWLNQVDIPSSVTIVTDGFRRCPRDDSAEVSIGRLEIEQSIDFITDLRPGLSEAEAAEIHHIHDGNPAAIEIAHERGSMDEPLSGDALEELWMQVYDDRISGEEYDLLKNSSHLIDLDSVDVSTVTDKTRGEARELLKSLESKGVVSRKQSRLFNTDQYVKRYTSTRLDDRDLSDKHRMSFKNYAERWAEAYDSRMQEMETKPKGDDGESGPSLPDFDAGLTDSNLFLAVYHLSQIYVELDREAFVEELQEVDADTSGVFAFGMLAQRFFFEEPTEVIQDLSEAILGLDEDIENELFSGTIGVFFDFDIDEYVAEISKGWSTSSIETDHLNMNWSDPDNIIERLGENIDSEAYTELPPKVKTALLHFIAIPLTDTRTARDYYQRFGKTAREHGLDEEPFCLWLEEVEALIEELRMEDDPDDTDGQQDPHERGLETLNEGIRDRIELKEYLNANHTQAQTEFQHHLQLIRDRPDEIAEQYIRCGEELERMDNCMFAYLWYALGHKMFSKLVLGEPHWDIYGAYNRLSGERKQFEKTRDSDELVITMAEIEDRLS